MRSPTAAEIAPSLLGIEADFAGLSADADVPLASDQLDWADTIAVMERAQLSRLKRQFAAKLRGKKLVCLDVPDDFAFRQPELVELLSRRFARLSGGKP